MLVREFPLPKDEGGFSLPAGAGMGLLIGFVACVANAGSGRGTEPATPPACQQTVPELMAPAEDTLDTEGTK